MLNRVSSLISIVSTFISPDLVDSEAVVAVVKLLVPPARLPAAKCHRIREDSRQVRGGEILFIDLINEIFT